MKKYKVKTDLEDVLEEFKIEVTGDIDLTGNMSLDTALNGYVISIFIPYPKKEKSFEEEVIEEIENLIRDRANSLKSIDKHNFAWNVACKIQRKVDNSIWFKEMFEESLEATS